MSDCMPYHPLDAMLPKAWPCYVLSYYGYAVSPSSILGDKPSIAWRSNGWTNVTTLSSADDILTIIWPDGCEFTVAALKQLWSVACPQVPPTFFPTWDYNHAVAHYDAECKVAIFFVRPSGEMLADLAEAATVATHTFHG